MEFILTMFSVYYVFCKIYFKLTRLLATTGKGITKNKKNLITSNELILFLILHLNKYTV